MEYYSQVYKNYPSQAEAQKLFSYCSDTGNLHWKKAPTASVKVGSVAGGIHINHDGYTRVTLSGRKLYASALIWIYHNGEIPYGVTVDHRDRNRQNNRIENLRLLPALKQTYNQDHLGFTKREFKTKTTWEAYISAPASGFKLHTDGKRRSKTRWLGSFQTALQARLAYERATVERDTEINDTRLTKLINAFIRAGVATNVS